MTSKRLLAGALLCGSMLGAHAQGIGPLAVEERDLSAPVAQTAASPISEDGLMLLMQQQTVLEEQIQHLQGQLEELRHELQQVKDAERERYLDLDARINALAGGAQQTQPQEPAAAEENDPQADRDSYQAAKKLLVSGDFAGAIDALEDYLKAFPAGQSRADAHFWLAKLYSDKATPDTESAKQHFQALAEDHPEHSKAPKSLYLLAVMQARASEFAPAKINLSALAR